METNSTIKRWINDCLLEAVRRRIKVITLLTFALFIVADYTAYASSIMTYSGEYRDKYITLKMEIESASWINQSGAGSSERLKLRLLPRKNNTVSDALVIYKDKEYKLKMLPSSDSFEDSAEIELKPDGEEFELIFIYKPDRGKDRVITKKLSLKTVYKGNRDGILIIKAKNADPILKK